MRVSKYGSYESLNINPRAICYIMEEGFKCTTVFGNNASLELSYSGMKPLLKEFPRAYSYDFGCGVYMNPNQIIAVESGGFYKITFANGITLKELSGADCDRIKVLQDLENDMGM